MVRIEPSSNTTQFLHFDDENMQISQHFSLNIPLGKKGPNQKGDGH